MTFAEFRTILAGAYAPVILIEGTRSIPPEDCVLARGFAARLARTFPEALFRSGNAPGADQAFSEGIAAVDSSRLQVVLPYPGHRSAVRYPAARYASPRQLAPEGLDDMLRRTGRVSSETARLLIRQDKTPALKVKAQYLLRDTMKVVGFSDEFVRPSAAIFYANPDDPLSGGTGHTIRVCIQEGVPHVLQDRWKRWFPPE